MTHSTSSHMPLSVTKVGHIYSPIIFVNLFYLESPKNDRSTNARSSHDQSKHVVNVDVVVVGYARNTVVGIAPVRAQSTDES